MITIGNSIKNGTIIRNRIKGALEFAEWGIQEKADGSRDGRAMPP